MDKEDFIHDESVDVAGLYTGDALLNNAKIASDKEHELGFRQAMKIYPQAVFWSFILSLTIVMEGYDTSLMSNFYTYPAFAAKYGTYFDSTTNSMQISGPWQTALGDATEIGTFFGALLNGYFCERFGHRKILCTSLFFLAAFIFIIFFSPSVQVLLVGQILVGFPLGVFATVGPAYASEVCPLALRGYLTAYINLCWSIGQLISAGVLQGMKNVDSKWSYRVPQAIQWVWPLPIFILVFIAPESPWWLVRRGRLVDAERSVKRLSSKNALATPREMIAMMIHTTKLEQQLQSNDSYIQCFKGIDLRRTEIACMVLVGQVMCGGPFAYSPTYFFVQAGLSSDNSYKVNLGATALGFVGTVLSWFLLPKMGRRTIYTWGMATMCFLLFLVGFLSLAPDTNQSALWAAAAMTVIWHLVYSLTIGPIGWTIASEISATRLRQQTVCVARVAYYLINIIAGVVEPQLINVTENNWKGKTAFFWAGSALIHTCWCVFRLPEAKDRTYEELDIMFERRVPAMKFRKYEVNAFEDQNAINAAMTTTSGPETGEATVEQREAEEKTK
ncbi:general substrate transporter [Myxozyma melibiosi]|uniref:General substrate transporter n=1 Tax=Myxozyma melibiosi TaxID=54550 RepID=A0ABR1FCS8_9ASCO